MMRPSKRMTLGLVAVLLLVAADIATAAGNAPRVGRWEEPRRWPVIGIHSFVLPTGDVMQYAYTKAQGPEDDRYYYDGTKARVWNPKTDKFKDASFAGSAFCSGHSFLADGRLFVTGGLAQEDCITQGRVETFLFDAFAGEWEPYQDMRMPRYYPTNLTLGDGRVLILSGNNERCTLTSAMEVYVPGEGIKLEPEGRKQLRLYPRVHLLPDGTVAHVGPEPRTSIYDPDNPGWVGVARPNHDKFRYEGTSFLVPGEPWKVMMCGGFETPDDGPTDTCEIIDFSDPKPRWQYTAPMVAPRAHANAVLLPDGQVMIVGGGGHGLYDDPVQQAEIYDPKTNRWTQVGSNRYSRMYHSTAILLPDGRVLSAGQDQDPSGQRGSGAWGELYRPPYMERGKRPRIRKAPETLFYGETVPMKVKPGRRIESMVLMALPAVTHSVNQSQRYVELPFEFIKGAKLEVEVPNNPNLAPPGYYMLFAVADGGLPSEAQMVRVAPPALPVDG